MKRILSIIAAGLMLASCAVFSSALVSQTTPVPGQAKTVFGAELTYDFLVETAQHAVDTGLVTAPQKAIIHAAVLRSKPVLDAARQAAERQDNAAIATGLAALNAANIDLGKTIAASGVQFAK